MMMRVMEETLITTEGEEIVILLMKMMVLGDNQKEMIMKEVISTDNETTMIGKKRDKRGNSTMVKDTETVIMATGMMTLGSKGGS
mmetsp:Transcript_12473/g.15635  ORF Transcript_12473/g.15635 Transcript_12473/m.15635 type:complete len:85 (+) Transcript_12473:1239-1493(+)